MILPDDRPESPSKLNPAPAQAAQQAQEPPPPPAYPGHEASSSRLEAGPSEAQPIYVPVLPVYLRRGEPAGKRFCQAFCVALLIYVLLAAVTSSIAEVGRNVHRGWNREELEDLKTAEPRSGDGKVLHCIKGRLAWPHNGEPVVTTFKLDRLADVLYMFTRGEFLGGNVVLTQDGRTEDLDLVYVDVAPTHATPNWLHAVSVCSLMRSPTEMGIGIFGPTRWRSSRGIPSLDFEVTIRLPKLSDEILQIARLETNVPNFSQHIGDLNDTVLFRGLSLKSSNSHIFSQSLNAFDAEIITSNSRIGGHYQASDSLKLVTSNEPINVTATMVHRNPDKKEGPMLKLETSNAKILSSVNLVSALPPMEGGKGSAFRVETNTSNSRLSLDFPTAPVDSKLNLIARTSNANAEVRLHPTYEGKFSVKTSNHVAFVDSKPVSDPAGKGRVRNIVLTNKWADARGTALWSGEYMGNVDIRTSNGRAELYL